MPGHIAWSSAGGGGGSRGLPYWGRFPLGAPLPFPLSFSWLGRLASHDPRPQRSRLLRSLFSSFSKPALKPAVATVHLVVAACIMAGEGSSVSPPTGEADIKSQLEFTLRDIYVDASVPDTLIRTLFDHGIRKCANLRGLGAKREEARASLVEAYELPNTTPADKRGILHVLTAYDMAMETGQLDQQAKAVAKQTGLPIPLEDSDHADKISGLKSAYKARQFIWDLLPSAVYLAIIFGIIRSPDQRAEPLNKVTSNKHHQNARRGWGAGGGGAVILTHEVLGRIPANPQHFKDVMITMAGGWVAMALAFSHSVKWLADLHLDTFSAYCDFICGPLVADFQDRDGNRPRWTLVVEADMAIRNS